MSAKRTSRPKILLAWDIEDPAPAALAAVRRLIEGGAKAEAVYVASPGYSVMPEWDRRTLRAAWRDKLRKHGLELKVVEGGAVVERLLACIKERSPDLVVVGTKSSGWVESVLLGSVARMVRRRSSSPVLVIPAGKRG